LEGLEALGNMGVVPIVIFLTQVIKKRIGDFRYGTDVLALILSVVLCVGWEFYYMTPEAHAAWLSLSMLGLFKWTVSLLIKSLGTWFSASKIYDFSHGNKKRELKVSTQLERQQTEKVALQEEIEKLKNSNGDKDGQTEEDPEVSDKLRAILEGERSAWGSRYN